MATKDINESYTVELHIIASTDLNSEASMHTEITLFVKNINVCYRVPVQNYSQTQLSFRYCFTLRQGAIGKLLLHVCGTGKRMKKCGI